jgi:hypothetical protein
MGARFTLNEYCAQTWVGIYRGSGTDPQTSNPIMSLRTCGDQSCTAAGPASGLLSFDGVNDAACYPYQDYSSAACFPLAGGSDYFAYLVHA